MNCFCQKSLFPYPVCPASPQTVVSPLPTMTAACLIHLCWSQAPVMRVSRSRSWGCFFYYPQGHFSPGVDPQAEPAEHGDGSRCSLGPLPEQLPQTPLPTNRESGTVSEGCQPAGTREAPALLRDIPPRDVSSHCTCFASSSFLLKSWIPSLKVSKISIL